MPLSARVAQWHGPFQRGLTRLSQPWYTAAVVFLLALAVRVTYNLTVVSHYVPTSDALQYDELARHLLQWHCFCEHAPAHYTTVRLPLFPVFLAGVYVIAGVNTLDGRLALSVVGAITCVLVSMMARDLFGKRTGLLAGLIAATYPQLFVYDAWLYSESLAICLFAASCLTMMRAIPKPLGWRWLLVGVLLGLTALTRPNGIYGLLAVLAWLALAALARTLTWKRATIGSALILLGCLIVLTPWTIRTAIVTDGAFAPFGTGSGIVIAGAYNDTISSNPSYGGFWVNPLDVPADAAVMRQFPTDCWGVCEVEYDQAARTLGIDWAFSHLQLLPRLLWLRMVQFWRPALPSAQGGLPISQSLANIYPAIIICLALLGLILVLKRRRLDALLPCFFGATVVLGALLFYGSVRLRAPLEPFLVVLASGAIGWIIQRLRQRRLSQMEQAHEVAVIAQRPA